MRLWKKKKECIWYIVLNHFTEKLIFEFSYDETDREGAISHAKRLAVFEGYAKTLTETVIDHL